MAVMAGMGMVMLGREGQSWYGAARTGVVRSCGLRYGKPRFGSQGAASCGSAWQGMSGRGAQTVTINLDSVKAKLGEA